MMKLTTQSAPTQQTTTIPNTPISNTPRYHLIDEFRGFLIVYMMIYHALWDLAYIYGVDLDWFRSSTNKFFELAAAFSFIFIAGFCWNFSKNNLKRGLLVYGAGMVISSVTLLLMPESQVLFGVLTLLGSAMVLMIPMELLLRKLPPLVGLLGSLLLFFFTYNSSSGYWGFGKLHLMDLPRSLRMNFITTWLGFPEPGFFSTDYFPILPWFFAFLTGYFAYRLIFTHNTAITEKGKGILSASVCRPFGWIGRKSLIIYMIHQPIIYGILFAWDLLFGI